VNERFERTWRASSRSAIAFRPDARAQVEEDGVVAVEMMAGQAGHVDWDLVPSVIYTFPELASVGIGEDEPAARHRRSHRVFPFTANARAKALGETAGQAKVVADATTDRVLGVTILGPRAST